jgi:peptidyl-prolyl cis-trans isomerase C
VKKTALCSLLLATCCAVALAHPANAADAKPAATPKAITPVKPGSQPATPAPAATGDDPVVITAGTLAIHRSELEKAMDSLPDQYKQYALGPGKRQFAEQYLQMKLLASQGAAAGLDKSPELQAKLEMARENLLAQAQVKALEQEIKVSDEDLRKAYEAKKDQYEEVKARHILIAFKGSPAAQPGKPELTEDQAKAKAEDLRKQLVGGANFDELAKKESDDQGSAAHGGDLGAFHRGQMVPEFENAAFAAKPGEITPVVRTQFGFHIIKVDSHETTPFEKVKDSLVDEQKQAKLQELLEKMKTDTKATFDPAYFPAQPAGMPPGHP